MYELHNDNKTEKNHHFSIDRVLVMVFILLCIQRVWVHIY